ncbi:MAG TPA: hypothetical protein VHS06_10235, partial [Chloroflexota bacterium]|nr:hypothetical protein [Chloroflexota bacterium]
MGPVGVAVGEGVGVAVGVRVGAGVDVAEGIGMAVGLSADMGDGEDAATMLASPCPVCVMIPMQNSNTED